MEDAHTGLRLSTAKLPLAERGPFVQSLYERKLFPTRLNPLPDRKVHLNATWKLLPGVRIICGTFGGLRSESVVESEGNDDLTLGLSLMGKSMFSQRHRQLHVEEHTGVVTTYALGAINFTLPSGRGVGLRISRKWIAPLVPNLDDAVMRLAIPCGSATTLLAKYAEAVANDKSTITPEFGYFIAQHIHDLFAVALRAPRDTVEFVKTRGVKAARLRLIKEDILKHLGDSNLRASAVAARQGVSARYVHKLFEGEGTSFSDFVLGQRLSRGYRIFSDPLRLNRPISSVAFELGFGDLSHFNHCFRRRYGMTPSDVRAQSSS